MKETKDKLMNTYGLTEAEADKTIEMFPLKVVWDACNHTGFRSKQALKMSLMIKYKLYQDKQL